MFLVYFTANGVLYANRILLAYVYQCTFLNDHTNSYLFPERLCKSGLGAALAYIKLTVTWSLGADNLNLRTRRQLDPPR